MRLCFSEHDFYTRTSHRLPKQCVFPNFSIIFYFLLCPLWLPFRSSGRCWAPVFGLVGDGAQTPYFSFGKASLVCFFFWTAPWSFTQQLVNTNAFNSEHVEEKGICDLVVPSPGIYWNDESNLCLYRINVEIFTRTLCLGVSLCTQILGF